MRNCNAKTKFFSIEPLIGSVDRLDYTDIDWVIVGGERIWSKRCQKRVVEDVQQKCEKLDIPFFFKQWGGVNKKTNGRIYDELPSIKSTGLFSA